MRLVDAELAAQKFMILANEPDYQHEGEDWRSGLYMAESALDGLPTANVVEQIFTDLDSILRRSKTTLIGQPFYCSVLDSYVVELKKKYGVN